MSEPTAAAAAGTASNATGTNSRGGGRGGRGRNRFTRRGNRSGRAEGSRSTASVNRTKFKGETEEMNAHVYQLYDEQDDRRQFSKTTEALKSYVKKTMRYPDDLSPLFADPMTVPTLTIPADPVPAVAGGVISQTATMIWTEEVKEYVKRNAQLKSNMAAVYAVVWGQCSEEMRSRLRSNDEYPAKTVANDCVWLLKEIQAITMQFDEKKNSFLALLEARAGFSNCKQDGQTVDEYVESVKAWSDTVEHQGGTISESHELINALNPNGTPWSDDQRKRLAKDRTLAMAIIRGADPTRYGTLIDDLSNEYAMGRDNYPTTLTAAYNVLVSYKTPANARARGNSATHAQNETASASEVSGMTFAQRTLVPGRDGQSHNRVTCFSCQSHGHYATECPNGGAGTEAPATSEPANPAVASTVTTTGTTLIQYGYMLTIRDAAAQRVPTFDAVPLPAPIAAHHSKVTLCVDFLYVQGIPFFHTISRNIGFRTISPVPSRTKGTILLETRAVVQLYEARGLHVRDMHADAEFECIRHDIHPIELDVVPPDVHVGEVERSIRVVKERMRCTVHGLPFRRLPRLLVREIVGDAVRCLNMFPRANGVSDTMSPTTIITGRPLPDYNNMRIELGAYAQVFEDEEPTNTPRSRSLGAIALTPTGNAQGAYYFLSLATGRRISRHQWTELPITNAAIARVEALASQEGQPLVQERGLVVEWRHNQLIDDDEYDLDFEPAGAPAGDDWLDDFDPIAPDEPAALLADEPAGPPPFAPPPDDGDAGAHDWADGNHENEDDDSNNNDPMVSTETDNDDDDDGDTVATSADSTTGTAAPTGEPPEQPQPQRQHNYNLRQNTRAPARYANNKTTLTQCSEPTTNGNVGYVSMDERQKFAFGHIMTQMSANAGIKKHGAAAEAALMKEFAQLEDLSVFEGVDPTTLTPEQRHGALRAINLIKEKRDGKLKGRTVADGRPQRSLYNKSETASPAVSSDALLLSIIIDAHEGRDVATADVAGAYLNAEMEDFVVMKFTGKYAEIMCRMNPDYGKLLVSERGNKTLYVRLVKALYGCVKSALLWYKLFSGTLQEMGFVLNPYDPCVANCEIEGKQCTIVWYVDDNKISHVSPSVVTEIIEKIEERFGKMTVTRGKEHVFLGMKIVYNGNGTATITMKDYLREAIAESGLDITRGATNPARRDLFEVDEKSPPLPKRRAETFHSIVAKLLYVSIRARLDILLAIAFLCTRVSKSTAQDEKKLKRVLEYLSDTIDLEFTVGADSMRKLRTWVDAAYAVHEDFKSHTGGCMSLGVGAILGKSSKQKLNVKSSTGAEVVGASDYLGNTLWVKMFLEAQGYPIEQNFFEQDNQSAMKLEKNGRMSAGSKSRHIHIRYFWIKERTESNGIVIRHCPTLHMVADFFTKPLQGALFNRFRDVILGYQHVDTLQLDHPATTEERVEDSEISGEADLVESKEKAASKPEIKTKNRRAASVGNDETKYTTLRKLGQGDPKQRKETKEVPAENGWLVVKPRRKATWAEIVATKSAKGTTSTPRTSNPDKVVSSSLS